MPFTLRGLDLPSKPQPATCPDCNGTGINPFKFPDARCPCTYPADLPENCSGCLGATLHHTCGKEPDATKQPTPTMPLLTDKELHYICFNITGPLPILARMTPAEHSIALSDLCYAVAKQQRDADMAWHNEQIKPMVEALKIARGHLDCGWIELAKKAIDAVLKGEGK